MHYDPYADVWTEAEASAVNLPSVLLTPYASASPNIGIH